MRIVDDDITVEYNEQKVNDYSSKVEEEFEENAPVVVGKLVRESNVNYKKDELWKTIESDDDSDVSRMKKPKAHESDSDQSPPRKQNDRSLPRRRHDSDSDQSPPRKKYRDSDSDHSPPRRKQRHDSDSDHSPPRRKKRHDSDSDHSPPRRKRRHDSDSDQSPPRNRHDSDQSPPRRKEKHDSDSDQSPPRKHHESESLPRAKKKPQSPKRRSTSSIKAEKGEEKDGRGRAKKTLAGSKAGLQSAKDMKKEAKKLKKKEDDLFAMMENDVLGKGAVTVVRDKSGKKRDLVAEAEAEKEKLMKKAEKDAKYQQWGKGLKQQEFQDDAIADAIHEVSKPLARYKDDEDLDAMLRAKLHEGDPMLQFMRKKKAKVKKARGDPEKPQYRGPEGPPNRFGIPPGYRWDGVNRSNGFERKLFTRRVDSDATKEIAYKWSSADM